MFIWLFVTQLYRTFLTLILLAPFIPSFGVRCHPRRRGPQTIHRVGSLRRTFLRVQGRADASGNQERRPTKSVDIGRKRWNFSFPRLPLTDWLRKFWMSTLQSVDHSMVGWPMKPRKPYKKQQKTFLLKHLTRVVLACFIAGHLRWRQKIWIWLCLSGTTTLETSHILGTKEQKHLASQVERSS